MDGVTWLKSATCPSTEAYTPSRTLLPVWALLSVSINNQFSMVLSDAEVRKGMSEGGINGLSGGGFAGGFAVSG